MFEHSLDHPATVRMDGEMVYLTCKSIDDELDVLWRHTLNGLLNDMVAILILNTFDHLRFEFFDYAGLLVGQDVLKGLLHDSATVHLGRKVHHAVFHLICQDLLLCLISMLKQFLDDVVAEDVSHQLKRVGLNLGKYLVFLIAVCCLQLLLDEPRAVLITAEFDDMTINILFRLTLGDTYSRGNG